MGWRTVVINKTAKLDYKMGYLCVRTSEELTRIHISEIETLMIETTSVSITAYLLVALANEKVNVIFCDERRCPQGQYTPFYGSYDTSDKIRKQIVWAKEAKQHIWKSVITHKILGQSAVLKAHNHQTESDKLLTYIPDIQEGDSTNREGHAAKVYFNGIFGMNFTRKNSESEINAALNYGYSILLSSVAREIISNGYLTQIGIFHDNIFNQFNLASDLMEPFRPFVDHHILSLNIEQFGHDEKLKIAALPTIHVKIDGKQQFFSNALTIYVKSILDAIDINNPSIIKFPDYELQTYESDTIL